MAKFDASKLAKYVKRHKTPLVVAGDGCDRIELGDRRLVDYAALVAKKLNCPVAATGNTILALKKQEGVEAKKMWLAELFRFLEGKWSESISAKRPDLLILIGYHPEIVNGLVSGVSRLHTVFLGPGALPAADQSLEETPLSEWKENLEALVAAL